MINKKEWNKLSEESKWNLYTNKDVKKNINNNNKYYDKYQDVSDLFIFYDYSLAMINPYNKNQIMYYSLNGFQFNTVDFKRSSNLFEHKRKAIFVDCKIEDLKVGDFFRTTLSDISYLNTFKTKHIGLITKIDKYNIYYVYFDKDFTLDQDIVDITLVNGVAYLYDNCGYQKVTTLAIK